MAARVPEIETEKPKSSLLPGSSCVSRVTSSQVPSSCRSKDVGAAGGGEPGHGVGRTDHGVVAVEGHGGPEVVGQEAVARQELLDEGEQPVGLTLEHVGRSGAAAVVVVSRRTDEDRVARDGNPASEQVAEVAVGSEEVVDVLEEAERTALVDPYGAGAGDRGVGVADRAADGQIAVDVDGVAEQVVVGEAAAAEDAEVVVLGAGGRGGAREGKGSEQGQASQSGFHGVVPLVPKVEQGVGR